MFPSIHLDVGRMLFSVALTVERSASVHVVAFGKHLLSAERYAGCTGVRLLGRGCGQFGGSYTRSISRVLADNQPPEVWCPLGHWPGNPLLMA